MNFSKLTKYTIAVLLVTDWSFSTVYFFWKFQLKNIQSFLPEEMAGNINYFNEDEFSKSAENYYAKMVQNKNQYVVFSFIDSDCPCSKFTEKHIIELKNKYGKNNIQFISVYKNKNEFFDKVPASPSVAVMDKSGRAVYFGPFSDQAACGSTAGFIEPVIENMIRGSESRQMNLLANGCFCRRERRI